MSAVSAEVVSYLLSDAIWVNNDSATVAGNDVASALADDSQKHRAYLHAEVFPTLIPALHDMLEHLQSTLDRPSANAAACPFRDAEGNLTDGAATTQCQLPTHTGAQRKSATFGSSCDGNFTGIMAKSAEVEAAARVPAYGPTGRCHPVEWLAQALMRNNPHFSAGYADHPYCQLFRAKAKNEQ